MSTRIRKSLVVDGKTLVTEEAWNAELEAKHNQVVDWLRSEELDGVLLKRNENVAWLTGGAVELRVLTPNGRCVAVGYGRGCALLSDHRKRSAPPA
jgi:Xaa-Pro dipeptidase